MDDETGQAMLGHDAAHLALPKINGIVLEDVEERIILSRGDRQLQNLADEEGHYGTATAALGFQVSYVGNGHVICEIQSSIPVLISIQNSGTEAARSVFFSITIDSFCSEKKLFPVTEEMSIMVQIMDVDFKPTAANFF